MQLVVRDSAVELNGVFQLLHRNVKPLEEQPPRLAGDAQRFEAPSILAGTGETQFDTFGDHLLHGLSVQVETNHVKLPAVVDGFASEGIIQFFFEDADNNDSGFNIYILDESNRAEVYHHCEGSKEELVRDVSRFYSSSHDRFTYGSSFINFNLPQFYQIVEVDGRTQVIPFRTQAIAAAIPTSQDVTASPVLQQRYS